MYLTEYITINVTKYSYVSLNRQPCQLIFEYCSLVYCKFSFADHGLRPDNVQVYSLLLHNGLSILLSG